MNLPILETPAGIPLCPKSVGRKEETPCGYTFMPKERGQERGKEWQNVRERTGLGDIRGLL
jgi:hypothetical protein